MWNEPTVKGRRTEGQELWDGLRSSACQASAWRPTPHEPVGPIQSDGSLEDPEAFETLSLFIMYQLEELI